MSSARPFTGMGPVCRHKLVSQCSYDFLSPKCCACLDTRPHRESYTLTAYSNGSTTSSEIFRWSGYCAACQLFWENAVRQSGIPVSECRIPHFPNGIASSPAPDPPRQTRYVPPALRAESQGATERRPSSFSRQGRYQPPSFRFQNTPPSPIGSGGWRSRAENTPLAPFNSGWRSRIANPPAAAVGDGGVWRPGVATTERRMPLGTQSRTEKSPQSFDLGKAAEDASILLELFSKTKPADDKQIGDGHKQLISNALESVLKIHRALTNEDIELESVLGSEAEVEVEDLKMDVGCIICFHQVADTAFMPCGHLAVCGLCSDEMGVKEKQVAGPRTVKCPICRTKIIDRIKIFRG